jgi:hypothetical protein
METQVKTSKANSVNFATIQETINKIDQFVKDNDYQYKDRAGFAEITESSFNSAIQQLSKKKRKKLANYVWAVNNHPTLESINKFFHFFMKNIMKSDTRIKVIKSAKELAIEEKRKAYKEALAKVKATYADYKTEKGDFYKNRMQKKSI